MLIHTDLFQFATHAHLDRYDIHSPCTLGTVMQVKIMQCRLDNLSLFSFGHCLLGSPPGFTPPRLYLHENEIVLLLRDQVDLAIATPKVSLQNTISATR